MVSSLAIIVEKYYQSPDLRRVISNPMFREQAMRTLRADMELWETYLPCSEVIFTPVMHVGLLKVYL